MAVIGAVLGAANLILGIAIPDAISIVSGSVTLIINILLIYGVQKDSAVLARIRVHHSFCVFDSFSLCRC